MRLQRQRCSGTSCGAHLKNTPENAIRSFPCPADPYRNVAFTARPELSWGKIVPSRRLRCLLPNCAEPTSLSRRPECPPDRQPRLRNVLPWSGQRWRPDFACLFSSVSFG